VDTYYDSDPDSGKELFRTLSLVRGQADSIHVHDVLSGGKGKK
jgi:hypothetical protein